jgi:hypothetical protein
VCVCVEGGGVAMMGDGYEIVMTVVAVVIRCNSSQVRGGENG